jgi:hypothetical protein
MGGHASAEERGPGVVSYNVSGIDGGSVAGVRTVWTSWPIQTEDYENASDESKHRDW